MQAIINKLVEIYQEKEIKETAFAIEELIQKYKKLIQPNNYQVSEKDILLIAYGDHVRQENEKPLKTLKRFASKYLDGKINSIHILPFYPYSSDDGFSVVDYYKVNPALGEWEDVEAISGKFRLMFDAVVNHISSQSSWFKGFLANEDAYSNFFIESSPDTDLSEVVRPRALPLLSEYEDALGTKKYIWTTFSADQIDLNFENPKVLLQILDLLLFYVSKGAKLLRLDAIGFLWKVIGTTCIHLPQTHAIIQLVKLVLEEITQEVVLVTETNVPHKENISYFGDGNNEAQMVYNFTLPPLLAYSILKEDTAELRSWASTLSLPSQETCFFNFTASHDGVGVRPLQGILPDKEINFLAKTTEEHGGYISYKNNADGSQTPYELNCNYMDLISNPEEADDLRINKILLAQGVALAMPGVPGIYFHSLVGSRNYREGVQETGMNRTINREKLGYHLLEAQFDDRQSFRGAFFQKYMHLINTRIQQKTFFPFGYFTFPEIDKQVFSIQREWEGAKILCLFNISSGAIQLKLTNVKGIDLLTQETEDRGIVLAPWQQKWILLST